MSLDAFFHFTVLITRSILFLMTAFLTYKTVSLFLNVRPHLWAYILLYMASALLTHMVIFIGDIVNLLPSVILFLLAVWMCCTESGLHKLAIGMIFSTFAFSFNALMDNYIIVFFAFDASEYLFYVLTKFIFWLTTYLLFRRYAPGNGQELSPAMWKLMIALTLTPFSIVLFVVLFSSPYSNTIAGAQVSYFALLVIALFSVIGLFYTLQLLIKQQQLERQHILAETNQRYYEAMEQQQFEVRRLKHDMANQLNTAASLSDAQRSEYIQTLVQNPVFSQRITYCLNATVNAVLTAKASVMRAEQIPFDFHVDVPRELPLQKPDICALFANALDNAIEACRQLPVEKRSLTLETHLQKGLFVLKLNNSCADTTPLPAATSIRERFTTKPDKAYHGYGLYSIRETVQRCNGHLDIEKEQGMFTLFLYIPCEEWS